MVTTELRTFLVDNRDARSLANRFRRRRGELFRAFLGATPRPCSILDLGGTESFWIQSGLGSLEGVSITLLNLQPEPVSLSGISSIVGSAIDLSRFADDSFDIVFSNSVIEHVGSHENQRRMALETRRVGKRYFVQTPARSFPFEPHLHFPFFWQLPKGVREWLVCSMALGWYPRQQSRDDAREFLKNFLLLNRDEFQELFPEATIHEEKVWGLTKSYIAMSR